MIIPLNMEDPDDALLAEVLNTPEEIAQALIHAADEAWEEGEGTILDVDDQAFPTVIDALSDATASMETEGPDNPLFLQDTIPVTAREHVEEEQDQQASPEIEIAHPPDGVPAPVCDTGNEQDREPTGQDQDKTEMTKEHKFGQERVTTTSTAKRDTIRECVTPERATDKERATLTDQDLPQTADDQSRKPDAPKHTGLQTPTGGPESRPVSNAASTGQTIGTVTATTPSRKYAKEFFTQEDREEDQRNTIQEKQNEKPKHQAPKPAIDHTPTHQPAPSEEDRSAEEQRKAKIAETARTIAKGLLEARKKEERDAEKRREKRRELEIAQLPEEDLRQYLETPNVQ